MKPAAFDYVRAETREEALECLRREGGEARVLAGGQSLLPMLNMRLARPAVLVDVMRIAGLAEVRDDGARLTIGAGVRQAVLMARTDLAARVPLLALALPWVGHAQTRSRGTICGSVAHADPSAEMPLVMVALQGMVHLRNHRRARSVGAEDFYVGMMATAKDDDEMIEAVSLPVARAGAGYAFREIGRRHGDFAIVACAAVVEGESARLAVGGVADCPTARVLPMGDLDAALDGFAWDLDAREDLHATAAYRRALVRQVGRAVIEEAARCRG